jgi:hypothetical protein
MFKKQQILASLYQTLKRANSLDFVLSNTVIDKNPKKK